MADLVPQSWRLPKQMRDRQEFAMIAKP